LHSSIISIQTYVNCHLFSKAPKSFILKQRALKNFVIFIEKSPQSKSYSCWGQGLEECSSILHHHTEITNVPDHLISSWNWVHIRTLAPKLGLQKFQFLLLWDEGGLFVSQLKSHLDCFLRLMSQWIFHLIICYTHS
jgi:hypothetical protein